MLPCLQTRASRLSFNDIIRRLAQQPEDSPTYISKKASLTTYHAAGAHCAVRLGNMLELQDASSLDLATSDSCLSKHLFRHLPAFLQVPEVERFVVVHGQIILNQFKHFPNKAVKSSAFPAALRTALEMRRHLKLYASTSRSVTRVNRNPMKARALSSPGSFQFFALSFMHLVLIAVRHVSTAPGSEMHLCIPVMMCIRITTGSLGPQPAEADAGDGDRHGEGHLGQLLPVWQQRRR